MELNRDTIRKIQGLVLFTVVVVVAGVNYRVLVLLGRLLHIGGPLLRRSDRVYSQCADARIEAHLPVGKHRKSGVPSASVFQFCWLREFVSGIFCGGTGAIWTLWSLQRASPCFLPASRGGGAAVCQLSGDFGLHFRHSLTGTDFNQSGDFFESGAGTMLNTTFSAAVPSHRSNQFSISFIFSIYILMQKETLKRQVEMLLRAFFRRNR